MSIGVTTIGNLTVSRFIMGGNPFSGFSHQSTERDLEMKRYYTTERLTETLFQAQAAGINTLISRADHHVMRLLLEYWDAGGALQWIAQTCSELGPIANGVRNAINGGARACYIHGGQMDNRVANEQYDEIRDAIKMIHDAGMPAGVAAHNPRVFAWAEENLDADFYMCSYYNPASRDKDPSHVSGANEWFDDADREIMVQVIAQLSKPAIHYKVLAAGRNNPYDAFAFVARHLRPQDAVCVGVFTKDNTGMIEEDMRLLEAGLQAVKA